MCVEIEAKLKVDSLDAVARRLAQLGAEFEGTRSQRDYYFDDSCASMRKADKCLRLRYNNAGGQTKVFVTFKGSRQGGQFKRRREIEFEVGDLEAAGKLLAEFGLEKSIVVEKKRDLWRFAGCEVCLDEVAGLGNFVEIEGDDEKMIEKTQRILGLEELEHIKRSYACLLFERQK